MNSDPPRYAPDRPFPAYAFTPGMTPHPRRDPDGHSRGATRSEPAPLDPERWRDSEDYRFGIDLFNHGYYWEAHEAWEGLWIACGKHGVTADFLKGLIKLASAALKVRAHRPVGVEHHARHAAEHFDSVRRRTGNRMYAGLVLDELIAAAHRLEQDKDRPPPSGPGARTSLDLLILRSDEDGPI